MKYQNHSDLLHNYKKEKNECFDNLFKYYLKILYSNISYGIPITPEPIIELIKLKLVPTKLDSLNKP